VLCCFALAGLALFGPHGVRLYRVLTGKGSPIRPDRWPAEPTTSAHLIVEPRAKEELVDAATISS
jgi:hypothetical protein